MGAKVLTLKTGAQKHQRQFQQKKGLDKFENFVSEKFCHYLRLRPNKCNVDTGRAKIEQDRDVYSGPSRTGLVHKEARPPWPALALAA